MRVEGARHNQEKRSAREASSRWFDILAYPTSINGFDLNLVANGPRHISKRHRKHYGPFVEETLRTKEGTPGFHNPIKVNIHPLPLDAQHPNVLPYTATPTQYVEFLDLTGRKHVPERLLKEVRSSGVQVVWRTTEPDGSHKFVFEVRSKHAGLYPSFAGTIGGSIEGGDVPDIGILTNTGTLKDASPRRIIDQAVEEAEEELGIGKALGNNLRQDYESRNGNLVIMGIGRDKKRGYYDILCRGLLPLSQEQLQETYNAHKAAGNDNIQDPMPIRLVFMEDKPETYQKLLASHAPLTPMTQAPLLLAGYMSRMEEVLQATGNQQLALQEATTWKEQTISFMQRKDTEMDTKARIYRRTLTRQERQTATKALLQIFTTSPRKKQEAFDSLAQKTHAWWDGARRRPKGLATTLPPEEQGLPSTEETLSQIS